MGVEELMDYSRKEEFVFPRLRVNNSGNKRPREEERSLSVECSNDEQLACCSPRKAPMINEGRATSIQVLESPSKLAIHMDPPVPITIPSPVEFTFGTTRSFLQRCPFSFLQITNSFSEVQTFFHWRDHFQAGQYLFSPNEVK
ncbi:hypothetical protein PVK06_021056 [Gossypium arboreum]|uniref:Uncharacterized protein n=1 Tax=Gossypium arboreum TaxID=29729 RepID=A0ABR0PNZ0_GOSAR|nr:hypothetical protein PVK06_021056 [Gossypium arboreum]